MEPLGPGEKRRTFSFEKYVTLWEEAYGRKMTSTEKKTLARGCIGITALCIGLGNINPPLDNSFDTFAQASAEAAERSRELAAHGQDKRQKVYIYSQRFWSNGKPYTPDPVTGRVDMSDYDYEPKPGYVNFDYGFYDDETDSWWHANHAEPDMSVYQSTLADYSRPLLDFDRQVFSVAIGKRLR